MICKKKRKGLYYFVMAVNGAFWIFLFSVSSMCCQNTQQYVLDYNLVDNDLQKGRNEVDESVYQRDILGDADSHFALYHKDDTHRVRRPLLNVPQASGQQSNTAVSQDSLQSQESGKSDFQGNYYNAHLREESHPSVIDNNQSDKTNRKTATAASLSPYNSGSEIKNDKLSNVDKTKVAVNEEKGMGKGGKGNNTAEGTKSLPQAIIIGVKKGGTRALLEYLRMHPDVKAPGPEPHFFDKNFEKGFEWYRDLMPTSLPGQLTTEKTPSYFITKEVPRRIYTMSPNIKLIVVVRDPVTRAISDYTQGLDRRPDLKPFEQMAFLDNATEKVNTSWGAIKIGMYVSHLEKWLKYFPLKQIHFVDGERLITHPAREMYKVQQFLAISTVIDDTHFSLNSTKGFPCLVKPWKKGKPHCLDNSKGRKHPEVQKRALERLEEFYRSYNEKLFKVIGQDFGW